MTIEQRNYKLTLAYDGTDYCGWQVQPNGIAIQEVIQDKLAIILRTKTTLTGSPALQFRAALNRHAREIRLLPAPAR